MNRHERQERLERILERLDQVETEIFRLVEGEPVLIRKAETLEAFQHVKAAAFSLQALMKTGAAAPESNSSEAQTRQK
jgi:hypothetical protein